MSCKVVKTLNGSAKSESSTASVEPTLNGKSQEEPEMLVLLKKPCRLAICNIVVARVGEKCQRLSGDVRTCDSWQALHHGAVDVG